MSFGRGGQAVPEDPYDNAIPDEDASKIVSDAAQFADLHNRIQSVNHHLSTIFRSIGQNAAVGEQRHAETASMIGDIRTLLGRFEKLDVMEQRLRDIETEMRGMRHEMSGRLRDSENAIKYHVSDKHETLAQDDLGRDWESGCVGWRVCVLQEEEDVAEEVLVSEGNVGCGL